MNLKERTIMLIISIITCIILVPIIVPIIGVKNIKIWFSPKIDLLICSTIILVLLIKFFKMNIPNKKIPILLLIFSYLTIINSSVATLLFIIFNQY